MILFKASGSKTLKIKWLFYILIGISILVFIFNYSSWHFIIKLLVSIPVIVNILFDFFYLKQEYNEISKLSFGTDEIEIVDKSKVNKKIEYSNLKYAIRKRKFDKKKTEIEFKIKKGFLFKTFGRIHIKNWKSIFEVEKELIDRGVLKTRWVPKTLWGKYWGVFIDIFFLTITSGDGDLGMDEYQKNNKRS
jgi:hypothetical protein